METYSEQETEIEQAIAKLQDFVMSLGFSALRPVDVGYVELWLRSHLPQVYQLGKYQQKGDLIDERRNN